MSYQNTRVLNLNVVKINIKKLLTTNNNVDNALTTGVAPDRISENMYIGNVKTDAPAQKNDMRKSSSDTINTNSAAEIIAGDNIGRTIL